MSWSDRQLAILEGNVAQSAPEHNGTLSYARLLLDFIHEPSGLFIAFASIGFAVQFD
jgi:hypothetical protein